MQFLSAHPILLAINHTSCQRREEIKRKENNPAGVAHSQKKVDTNAHKYRYTMEFFRYIRNKLVIQAFRHNALAPAANKVGLGNNKNTRMWSELAKLGVHEQIEE